MKRRKFICTLSQSAIALNFTNQLAVFHPGKIYPVGVLLGTIEKHMLEDADSALKKIAAMGFTELEYPRTYGYPAEALKKIIKNNNLTSLGGGDNITQLTNNFQLYAEEYNRMGKKYVFCYWPWFDSGLNKTMDDWKRQAAILNQLGEKYKREGLRLAYHNHDIEFALTENKIPYDVLLQDTQPDFLTFQMDIWWIKKAGHSPLDFIASYPGRFEVCHIKTAGLLKGNEEVANLDYTEVLAQSASAGFNHYVLENEPGIEEPFTYFKKSYDLIKGFTK